MNSRVFSGEAPAQEPLGIDPLTQYTRLFCRFLQAVFATFEKGQYHWEQDDTLTDITIQDQASIQREVVEKRPAIIVARGPAAYANLAMDQLAGPIFQDTLLVNNMESGTGKRRHIDLVACTMTYNLLSREGLEAQRLAWVCMKATRELKRHLMRAGVHRVGEDIQVGAESSPGTVVQPDPGEVIMVSVSVPFWFQDSWTVEPRDKTLLNNVDLLLTSEARFTTRLNGPSINGRTIIPDKVFSITTRVPVGRLKPRELKR